MTTYRYTLTTALSVSELMALGHSAYTCILSTTDG